MEERYIKAIDPYKWIRPAGWLTIPTITSSDNKIAFLFAVYQNKENGMSLAYSINTINATVDWGDGTSTTINSTAIREKKYDYNSINSIVLTDKYGESYKQVIITVTYVSGTLSGVWTMPSSTSVGAAGYRIGALQVLEIVFSWPGALNLTSSANRTPLLLESVIIKKMTLTGTVSNYFSGVSGLRNIEGLDNIITTSVAAMSSFFQAVGDIGKIDYTFNHTNVSTSMFYTSNIRRIGNINFPNTSGVQQLLNIMPNLEEVGNVSCPSASNWQLAFASLYQLRKLGTITSTAMTTMTNMFQNCYSIREITFTSCANVTTIGTTAFGACYSLEKLRVPSIPITFSLTNCNFQRPEIITIFNDLATVVGQSLTLTYNPGVADLTAADLLIATNKGWTILI